MRVVGEHKCSNRLRRVCSGQREAHNRSTVRGVQHVAFYSNNSRTLWTFQRVSCVCYLRDHNICLYGEAGASVVTLVTDTRFPPTRHDHCVLQQAIYNMRIDCVRCEVYGWFLYAATLVYVGRGDGGSQYLCVACGELVRARRHE